MTVAQLTQKLPMKVLALPAPDREIEGGYVGDLLSWVMGNAPHGCAWVTIMTNRNIVAVAQLLELACIIVAEGCEVPEDVLDLAREQSVNVLSWPRDAFSLAAQLAQQL